MPSCGAEEASDTCLFVCLSDPSIHLRWHVHKSLVAPRHTRRYKHTHASHPWGTDKISRIRENEINISFLFIFLARLSAQPCSLSLVRRPAAHVSTLLHGQILARPQYTASKKIKASVRVLFADLPWSADQYRRPEEARSSRRTLLFIISVINIGVTMLAAGWASSPTVLANSTRHQAFTKP